MIALTLLSTALAAPWVSCDQDITGPELSVGLDLASHSNDGLRPQFDVMTTWPVWQCLRAGFRLYEATEGSITPFEGEQYLAAFLKSHGAIGGEVHGPLDLSLAQYALVGVKTVYVVQRQDDDRYAVLQWTPSVYSYTALRWRPTRRFGLHLDLVFPINDRDREIDWYSNRLIGIGVDVRLGRSSGTRTFDAP